MVVLFITPRGSRVIEILVSLSVSPLVPLLLLSRYVHGVPDVAQNFFTQFSLRNLVIEAAADLIYLLRPFLTLAANDFLHLISYNHARRVAATAVFLHRVSTSAVIIRPFLVSK